MSCEGGQARRGKWVRMVGRRGLREGCVAGDEAAFRVVGSKKKLFGGGRVEKGGAEGGLRGGLRGNVAGKNVRGGDNLGWKLILSKKTCFSIKNSFAFRPL